MKEMKIPFQTTLSSPPVSLPSHGEQKKNDTHSISILIGGAAGTGIITLEKILSDAFKRSGYFVFSTKEYMSRVRGGSNTTLLRIGNNTVQAPCWHVDLFVALDAKALLHVRERLIAKTIVLVDESIVDEQKKGVIAIPMLKTARRLGNVRYANSYIAGILFGMLKLDIATLLQSIIALLGKRSLEENKASVQEGCNYCNNLQHINLPKLSEPKSGPSDSSHLLDGSAAAGFGFLIGGCNMITSYPMSPSTGVLNFMASMAKDFTILTEQSEDEIASLNMVIGGWFGGARAMATTSGGGFALMSEAISLSGMSETPAVIYLAQRPGPATGLPTRSEQGDLNLAIHSGHGYFGRIVLAPGSLQECIDYGYLAFELADRYQVPVIYLSDEYLVDTIGTMEKVDFSVYEQRRYIQPTDATYYRYKFCEHGITPRGIPGWGDGIVVCTSDEHDEYGQITESSLVREKRVEKRQEKVAFITSEAHGPEVLGQGSIALIGWGSTKGAITEALNSLDDSRLFQVHFIWVHPLNPKHLEVLRQTTSNIVIENNVAGEFADILQNHGINISHRILQANGFAFFADLLREQLIKIIGEVK